MFAKMDKFVFIIISIIVIGIITEGFARPRSSRFRRTSRTRVYGVDEEDAEEVRHLVYEIKKVMADKHNHTLPDSELYNPVMRGDIVLSKEQAEEMLKNVQTGQNGTEVSEDAKGQSRVKRHSLDFEKFSWALWPSPIRYRIQEAPLSNFTVTDKEKIRAAFRRWELYTCLRFIENSTYEGNMIEVTGERTGCWSFVGRVRDLVIQTINLQTPECTILTGVAMHEIGHAIGLYHMEDSPNRDKYLEIIEKNIFEGLEVNLEPVSKKSTNKYGLPWDRASLMQFRRDAFSENGAYTILQKEPEYFYTAGMVDDISFLDQTLINRGYKCDEYCTEKLSSTNTPEPICKNGGYPDPGVMSDCTSCRCPAGLTGDCKDTPALGSTGCNPNSPNVIQVTEEGGFLESPGYNIDATYKVNDTCSWILESPKGTGIKFTFDPRFGVYHLDVSGGICHHYVEIKFNGKFMRPGKRYCGSELFVYNQQEVLTTYTNKALVYFNALSSDLLDNDPQKFVGFKLNYEISSKVGKPCKKIDKETGMAKCKRRSG